MRTITIEIRDTDVITLGVRAKSNGSTLEEEAAAALHELLEKSPAARGSLEEASGKLEHIEILHDVVWPSIVVEKAQPLNESQGEEEEIEDFDPFGQLRDPGDFE